MHNTTKILSAEWWITAVFAGVVIHILASYLRDGLDRVFPRLGSRLGSWLDSWIRRTNEGFADDIDRTKRDISHMAFIAARQASCHICALSWYLLGLGMFDLAGKFQGLDSTVFRLIGTLLFFAGAGEFGRAMRCKTILEGVLKGWNFRGPASDQKALPENVEPSPNNP